MEPIFQGVIRYSNFTIEEINPLINMFINAKSTDNKKMCLTKVFSIKKIELALFYASRNTYKSYCKLDLLGDKSIDRLFRTVYKYLLRMKSRSTPYGFFSCVSDKEIFSSPNEGDISYTKNNNPQIDIDVTLGFLINCYDNILDNYPIPQAARISLSPSLRNNNSYLKNYILGENPFFKKGDIINYPRNDFIDVVLEELTKSDLLFGDLNNKLIAIFPDILTDDITIALRTLLRERVLYLNFYPSNIGINLIDDFYKKISVFSELKELAEHIENIKKMIFNISKYPTVKDIQKLEKTMSIDNGVVINLKGINNLALNLNDKKEDIDTITDFLLSVQEKLTSLADASLEKFKFKFVEKYGYDSIVNLLDLFDENIGLGSPFTNEMISINDLKKWEEKVQKIKNIAHAGYKRNRNNSWNINSDDLKKIEEIFVDTSNKQGLNSGLDLNFKLTSEDTKKLLILGRSPWSRTVFSFNGRFKFLKNSYKYKIDKVSNLQYISANKKIQAIQTNGMIDENKIIATGYSDSESINVNSLYIFVNREGMFYLVDKNNNPVIVDQHNMANIHLHHDVVKFIILISSKISNIGSLLQIFENIYDDKQNRISYNNLVIVPKKWKITLEHLEHLKKQDDKINFICDYGINKKVTLAMNDETMDLDLTQKMDIEILEENIIKYKEVTLYECFNKFKINNEHVDTEITISFYKDQHKKINNTKYNFIQSEEKVDLFNGEEGCVYIKLYCELSLQNNLLLNHIKPFLNKMGIQKWFYIRYEDPREHIRLRIWLGSKLIFSKFMTFIYDLLKNKHLINDFSILPYEREEQRYGSGEKMLISESFFCLDSNISLNMLELQQNEGDLFGEVFEIYLIKKFIEKIKISSEMVNSMLMNELIKRKDYKKKYSEIQKIFNNNEEINKYLKNIESYADEMAVCCTEWLDLVDSEKEILKWVDSVLHMHFNRMYGNRSKESYLRIQLRRYLKECIHRNEGVLNE